MSAAFKKATEDSKKIVNDPSNDELLELYGSSINTSKLLPPPASSC